MNLKPALISISIFILCSTSAHAQLRADEYFRIGIGADIGYTTFYLSENSYSNKSWAETKVSFVQLQSRGRKLFYSARLMYQQSSVDFSGGTTNYGFANAYESHTTGKFWGYAEEYHTAGLLARLHVRLLDPNTRVQVSTGIGASLEKAIRHKVSQRYAENYVRDYHSGMVWENDSMYWDSHVTTTYTPFSLHINDNGLIGGLDFFINTQVAISRSIAITLELAFRPYYRPYLLSVKGDKILNMWYCGFHLDYSLWPRTQAKTR